MVSATDPPRPLVRTRFPVNESQADSAGGSPPRLVFRTVRETFALIRLLRGIILVMDTAFRDDFLAPMHSIMAMPVHGGQVLRVVVVAVAVSMMHFHQIPWSKKQSTFAAAASLPADAAGHPGPHPRVAPHASCPVTPVAVIGTSTALHLDVSDNPSLLVLAQRGSLGDRKGPAGEVPVFLHHPVPALVGMPPVAPAT